MNFRLLFLIVFILLSLFSVKYYLESSKISANPLVATQKIVNPTPTPKPTIDEWEDQIFTLVNKQRIDDGLEPLTRSSVLDKSAKLKLEDMLENDYFAHTSPRNVTPWYFFRLAGYDELYAGENLATGMVDPLNAITSWMASPTHKAEILSTRYIDSGIAVREVGSVNNSGYTVVQHFGSPRKNVPTVDSPGAQNQVTSRTGKIIPYHDWCNDEDISVYENELVTMTSSDGNTYSMTVDDWNCYENFLKNK